MYVPDLEIQYRRLVFVGAKVKLGIAQNCRPINRVNVPEPSQPASQTPTHLMPVLTIKGKKLSVIHLDMSCEARAQRPNLLRKEKWP